MDECGIYGVVQTIDGINGRVSGSDGIRGRVESQGYLIGEVGFPRCDYPLPYQGPYDVIPKAHTMQTLETNDKYMEDDVRVHEIPYYETSNLSGGTTCYIANEL